MKEIKVFYSQPMNGRSIKEIREERIKMQQEFREFLEELGFEDYILQDVNDHYEDPADQRLPYVPGRLWYLGRSIQTMDRADYVCFRKDCGNAFGCRVEMDICNLYFSAGKNLFGTKYIGIVYWGNNSGSKDLTVNDSDDTRK